VSKTRSIYLNGTYFWISCISILLNGLFNDFKMHLQILEAKNFRSIIIFKMKNSSSILKRIVNENRKNVKAYAVTSYQCCWRYWFLGIEQGKVGKSIRTWAMKGPHIKMQLFVMECKVRCIIKWRVKIESCYFLWV